MATERKVVGATIALKMMMLGALHQAAESTSAVL